MNSATSVSTHDSYSMSESNSWSRSEGGSRQLGLRAVWDTARSPYSLDEHFHLAQVKLRTLPDRFAIVKRSGKRSARIKTRDVPTALCAAAMLKRFRDTAYHHSPYVASVAVAEAEMTRRQANLGMASKEPADVNFWTE
jgi:hypothetical protein